MARSRIPHLYGIFQFCCRLILVVVEVCALAALIILTMYNDSFPAGYVAAILGILFSMCEMITLANATHQIPRMRPGFLVICDLLLCVLGMVSFFYIMIKRGWRPQEGKRWSPNDPFRDDKAVWAPWYIWLQLTAAILHFLYMIMHCFDTCRFQSSAQRNRRRQRRRAAEQGQQVR
ncbi:hypothetical protein F5X68DRAFT_17556 [Plectosphaerella plurivora]|uniref:Uncharacterized protein n=1 Tax=Plectosphaerella plurivora TaxID=936078 RepID=A0A9P8VAB7_9PEZI|nr:hypothetical protein F5X68DRAFT_17556 [Plectosphaerella plurivora]